MPRGVPKSGARKTAGVDKELEKLTQRIRNARTALAKKDNPENREKLRDLEDAKRLAKAAAAGALQAKPFLEKPFSKFWSEIE